MDEINPERNTLRAEITDFLSAPAPPVELDFLQVRSPRKQLRYNRNTKRIYGEKVTGQVKLQIPQGRPRRLLPWARRWVPEASTSSEFCKAFNAKTSAKDQEGLIIPVVIHDLL